MKIQELHEYFLSCSSLSTDTRKIEEGSMFVALKGDNFDANTFAEEALAKGARFVVIDNPAYNKNNKMLLVENSLQTLQELANYHRKYLGLPIVALTGSNGKTTTKELINAVLSSKYNTKATIGNLNNHIGVPLTLLSFTHETEIGIVEMGANHQKEIEMLCRIAEPNFGYITNFGKAHLEGFGGVEGVIKGKSELYDYLSENIKTAFVNLDDEIQKDRSRELSRYTFSAKEYNCDVRIENIEADPLVKLGFNGMSIQSNLIGSYNAPNICAAIAIGHYFKISDPKIKEAIEGYVPANNRSQLINRNGNTIILDAYNANPSSMAAAIENLLQLEKKAKIAILGDMFELGQESIEEHRKIVELLANEPEIETYFVGNDFYSVKIDQPRLHFFKDFIGFKDTLGNKIITDKTILIKGSRGMALERVLDFI